MCVCVSLAVCGWLLLPHAPRPAGVFLATAGDDHTIALYWPRDAASWGTVEDARALNKRMLPGSSADIYDLAWSPDSRRLVSGCVDCTLTVWDAGTGRTLDVVEEHANHVKGVAWDPRGVYIASTSSDRTLRVCVRRRRRRAGVGRARDGDDDNDDDDDVRSCADMRARAAAAPRPCRARWRASALLRRGSTLKTRAPWRRAVPLPRRRLCWCVGGTEVEGGGRRGLCALP